MDKLMRDEPPRRVRKPASFGCSASSLLGGRLVPSGVADGAAVDSAAAPAHVFSACLPWQESEKDERSNLLVNVHSRMRSLSDQKKLAFLTFIKDKTSVQTRLSRSVLHEALLAAELRVGSADAELLWSLYLKWVSACGGRELTYATVAQWAGLEMPPALVQLPVAAAAADEAAPVAVEGTQEEISEDWVVVEQSMVAEEASPPPAPPAELLLAPEAESAPPACGVDESTARAIAALQNMRATVALVFRQLPPSKDASSTTSAATPEQKTVRCSDLAAALTQHPLSLQLSPENAWRLACDLAGAPYASAEATAAFSDACRFLSDFDSGSQSKAATDRQLLTSIKRKLQSSKTISGDRVRLFALTASLRSRHRSKLQRGAQTASWQGVADECSVGEFVTLLRGIDVHLSSQEARLVASACRSDKGPADVYFADGVAIGAAVLFLGNALL